MAHIEKYKTNGYTYLRIAESYFDHDAKMQKKRVLKNLGSIANYDDGTPDFLERLREDFRYGRIELGGIKNNQIPERTYHYKLSYDPISKDFPIHLKNLGFIFLEKIYNDLDIVSVLSKYKAKKNLQIDLNGLTKLLVLGRILNPDSKASTFKTKDDYFKRIVSGAPAMQAIYDTLTALANRSSAIQARMNTRITNSSIGRKTDLTYYDVTNYYFEPPGREIQRGRYRFCRY